MVFLSEAELEDALLAQLESLGYARASDELIGPDGRHPERESHDEVILRGRLEAAVTRLNPHLPAEARADAVRKLTQCELPALLEENRRLHRLLIEGVDVEYYGEDLPAPRPGLFFTYAIRCSDGSIYIGQTSDLSHRWHEHQAGTAADHTRKFKPVRLEHYEEHSSREDAVAREKWLKTGYGRKWLRREIESGRARQAGGVLTGGKAALIDFDAPANNDWLAVQQLVMIAGPVKRRPDVVVFVNGLPLAVIELKCPGSENATLSGAFNQLQTYKQQIPALFHTNAVLVTTDGLAARVGSPSADYERFMPWRTTDGVEIAPKGAPELATLIEGVFAQQRLLDLLHHFTVFGETGTGLIKIIAGYHQFHAVRRAVESTLRASDVGRVSPPGRNPTPACMAKEDPGDYELPSVRQQPAGDRKAGVIWHTQGSGKSLLMAFYAGLLVKHPAMANPTLVVLTDRNDLDDQLFATFAMCRDLIRQTPVQAHDREHLRELLNRASGGVIFTTLQKFSPAAGEAEFPTLTERANVVVIADEAHRSQYGFKARMEARTGVIAYGFAKYLRDALPHASFIGFTGTPIEADDVNTPAVFGHYIDIYDISRAVEDGATVPIYYESRLARIELDEDEKPHIDDEIEALLEDEDAAAQERAKQKWSTVEALVGSDKRMRLVAEDMVRHLEDRLAALDGKAMVVCMSRRICVKRLR